MAVMTAVPATDRKLRPGDRLTTEEWLELTQRTGYPDPDGEDRWELIDGVLVVSAAPAERHQLMAQRLGRLLEDAAPPGFVVFAQPINVVIPPGNAFEPDGSVKRVSDFGDHLAMPIHVFEINSPSTSRRDWEEKRAAYARAGIASYWIGDPEAPSLTVLELGPSGTYVEVRTLTGDESAVIDRPFPVRICPADLIKL